MASRSREKLATVVDSESLAALRDLAKREGREIQALVDEAPADLIEKRQHRKPRAGVMAAYRTSHREFAPLYRKPAD
ncbi:conserved hypothetical protein [uncultured Pleomorphomonas sp.]|uniref:Uncharacterized protein n=1 Tax=uncultured Pleomorphomonas sp. TaxID=442121 RepID=A0A212L2H4_9HYPH|nr:hypothetical protein [uncultured Pleomorphomonas sp.]SCM71716.1 conserved hypothetical protein [uncultured Pleomorphomonas sp.]